jgi:hypothetical protein
MSIRICFFGDSIVNGTGDDACLGWVGRICSPVYARVLSDPANIRIRLGTLAQNAQAKVVAHVWVSSKPG